MSLDTPPLRRAQIALRSADGSPYGLSDNPLRSVQNAPAAE